MKLFSKKKKRRQSRKRHIATFDDALDHALIVKARRDTDWAERVAMKNRNLDDKPDDPVELKKVELKGELFEQAIKRLRDDPEKFDEYSNLLVDEMFGHPPRDMDEDGRYHYYDDGDDRSAIRRLSDELEELYELKDKLGLGETKNDSIFTQLLNTELFKGIGQALVGRMFGGRGQEEPSPERTYIVSINGSPREVSEEQYLRLQDQGKLAPVKEISLDKPHIDKPHTDKSHTDRPHAELGIPGINKVQTHPDSDYSDGEYHIDEYPIEEYPIGEYPTDESPIVEPVPVESSDVETIGAATTTNERSTMKDATGSTKDAIGDMRHVHDDDRIHGAEIPSGKPHAPRDIQGGEIDTVDLRISERQVASGGIPDEIKDYLDLELLCRYMDDSPDALMVDLEAGVGAGDDTAMFMWGLLATVNIDGFVNMIGPHINDPEIGKHVRLLLSDDGMDWLNEAMQVIREREMAIGYIQQASESQEDSQMEEIQ